MIFLANFSHDFNNNFGIKISFSSIKKRKKIITSISGIKTGKQKKLYSECNLETLQELPEEFLVPKCVYYNEFLETGEVGDVIANQLEKIITCKFNIFEFNKAVGRQMTLPLIYYYVLSKSCREYFIEINKIKLKSFIQEIYRGYRRDVNYHNDLHGSDLVQVLGVWLTNSNIIQQLQFKMIDIFSIITAACIHDFRHPGQNNAYQINFLSPIALTFNDVSVLESFHVSEGFKVISKPENNFMREFLSNDEFKYVRKRMIECVLATDMAFHSKVISNVKSKVDIRKITNGQDIDKLLEDSSNTKKLFDDQQDVLNLMIHLADLGHNSKGSLISYKWSILLYEEFFQQGDLEKAAGKPISFLCDRETTDISKSQIGFIKFVISPSFDLLYNLIPETKYYFDNVQENLKFWEKKVEEKEQKEKELEKIKARSNSTFLPISNEKIIIK